MSGHARYKQHCAFHSACCPGSGISYIQTSLSEREFCREFNSKDATFLDDDVIIVTAAAADNRTQSICVLFSPSVYYGNAQ